MIIRIQTEYGMKRVDVNLSDATEELYGKVEKTFRGWKSFLQNCLYSSLNSCFQVFIEIEGLKNGKQATFVQN